MFKIEIVNNRETASIRLLIGTPKMGRRDTGRPQWPKLTHKTLKPQSLYRGEQMLVMEGCLTEQEARRFVEAAESVGFQHQGSRGAAFGEAFRDNHRIAFQDAQLAFQLWEATGLREVLADVRLDGQRAVGLNPNIRIYRYSSGQRFGRHVDDSCEVESPRGETQYTLLVYLSGAAGGETVFYDDRGRRVAAVAPAPGLALLHRHGDHCLEHEGAVVRDGTKYVLRSDVVYA